jgi:hypothetical protein
LEWLLEEALRIFIPLHHARLILFSGWFIKKFPYSIPECVFIIPAN